MVTPDSMISHRDKAIVIAWDFVRAKGFKVLTLDSCEWIDSEPSDWVARFSLVLPDDVACGGELLLITVDSIDWTVSVFETL